jgi:hypothetical protein
VAHVAVQIGAAYRTEERGEVAMVGPGGERRKTGNREE